MAAYQQAVGAAGFRHDEAQWQATQCLQACFEALLAEGATGCRGVYLWGPVGRGKTWLMDQFHACLPVPARRQHFHHFMSWVHQRLFQLNGTPDPLKALALQLAGEIRVLCFDELFVSDIGDAIILGRLVQVLIDVGVVLVVTSNQPPHLLYPDGFNRERFVPAIAALQRHMDIILVDGGADHRLHPGRCVQRYWVRQATVDSPLREVFCQWEGHMPADHRDEVIGGRRIRVLGRGQRVLWCRFADVCEAALAATDFMHLCDRYQALLIDDVPSLSAAQRPGLIARGTEDGARRIDAGDRTLPSLSIHDDSVRRFIALVDECYDRRVPLYLLADVPLERLYDEGYLTFAFRRTHSRLQEMQWARFTPDVAGLDEQA